MQCLLATGFGTNQVTPSSASFPSPASPQWERRYSTWSWDKDRLLGGSSFVTGTHHVMAEDPEVVAIANDEL